jgi:hypothetical protein
MDYLEIELNSYVDSLQHGSTDAEMNIEFRLSQKFSHQTFDLFFLKDADDQACYNKAVLMQDWTIDCDFLKDDSKTVLGTTLHLLKIYNKTTLSMVEFKGTKIIVDNTPFPDGYIQSRHT